MINEKKLQIIETATRLFVEQGFENTPTAQISKEANVATGTLFYHYKAKEELINAIYIYFKKDMSAFIFKDFDINGEIKYEIKKVFISLIKWGFENKLGNQFLSKFYNSVYISKISQKEIGKDFAYGLELFKKAKEAKITKNISLKLHQLITFNLSQAFITNFQNLRKLTKNDLEYCFDIYWGAIGN